MAMNLKYLTVVVLGSLLMSPSGFALENFKDFKRDTWDFDIATEYFHSEANYTSYGGGSQNLFNGNSYQLIDTQFRTRYVPRPSHSFFGWVTLSNAESVDSVATRKNSAISSGALGMDFMLYADLFEAIGEVIAVMPFENIEEGSDRVFTNEGVFELRSRLILQKKFGAARGYGWLGFNYRAGGRSFLMPWGAGAQTRLGNVLLGAEIFGYQSVSDDTDKNNFLRTSYVNAVNAGSMKFYSINPSLIDSQAYVQFALGTHWTVQGQGGMTLAGENSAAGFHVGAFIRYSFDMTSGYRIEESPRNTTSPVPKQRSNMYDQRDTTLSSEKKVRGFREDTSDGVDQGAFKPRPTPKKKKKSEEDYLQQQLDATEFEVELKQKGR